MVVSNIFYVHPSNWGNDPIWRAYFSDGLVQPPTRLPNVVFSGMGTTKRSVESVIQWKKTSQHPMNWMVLWMNDFLFGRKEGKKSSLPDDMIFFEFWAKWSFILEVTFFETILGDSFLWWPADIFLGSRKDQQAAFFSQIRCRTAD